MKTRIAIAAACAASALACGCTDRQMAGTLTGTSLGGVFGSSIGGLMGGPRGSDLGTAIGMVAGGVIGNTVAGATERQTCDDSRSEDKARRRGEGSGEPAATPPGRIEGLSVENIRFVDDGRDQCLNGGERAEILFEIHNTGASPLRDIAPVLTCSEPKRIAISPTAIVGSLEPGEGVTYTAAMAVSPRIKDGYVTFDLAFQCGSRTVSYKTFQIPSKRK